VPDFRRPAPLQAADRLQGINPFRVMTVLERAKALERQGRNIIHLEVGEPDFVTAEPLVEAGCAALASGHTAYTPAAGLPQLREAIAGHYLARHGLQIPAHRIFVTPGASGALSLLAQMLLNPGDAVLMTDPGYPCNRNYVRLAGAEAILVPVTAGDNYQLTPRLLTQHATAACRSVWLASPSNPTGTVLDLPALQGIHAWCRTQGCHLLVDEIYHGLDYVGGLPSALQLGDDVLVVNSFSKYFGMTGWRLGWFVVPESLVGVSNILAQNLFIAASSVAQYAALRAFDVDTQAIFEARRREFATRRDFLTRVLRELGFRVPVTPQGAFYVYAGIEAFSDDSEQFCRILLEDFGVATTPGTDFGEFESRLHVRFAFTTGMRELEQAAERLRAAVERGAFKV
jgi:aspartate/methionine/tyrosine aminotransferase